MPESNSMSTNLAGLLARVKTATGPDRKLDYAIFTAFAPMDVGSYWHPTEGNQYTASIDAALALVERMLPGHRWGISTHSIKSGAKNERGWPLHADGFRAHVTERSALRPMPSIADAPTAPLAILAATLSALITQGALHAV